MSSSETSSQLPIPPPNTSSITRPGSSAITYHIPTAPPSPAQPVLKPTISLPQGSSWTSGLHFHVRHTEYLHLLRGSIFVQLNGTTHMFSADAGGQINPSTGALEEHGLVVQVPRYARHNWGRADSFVPSSSSSSSSKQDIKSITIGSEKPGDWDDEVMVQEWTDPSDIGKPLFFWNLNGVITAQDDRLSFLQGLVKMMLGEWWVDFQLFVIFWELDNWPAFLDFERSGRGAALDGLRVWIMNLVEYVLTLVVLFLAKVVAWFIGIRAVEKKRIPDELWRAYRRQ